MCYGAVLKMKVAWFFWDAVCSWFVHVQNAFRLPSSGPPQSQQYSTSLPTSSAGPAVSQTHTYHTGSPAGGQPSKLSQPPPWSSRMPPRCYSGNLSLSDFYTIKSVTCPIVSIALSQLCNLWVGAHLRLWGSEPAVSANTTQLYRR